MHVRFDFVTMCLFIASHVAAQTPPIPIPDPLVLENATVKLAEHTYVIPDGDVFLVPNVGIVVGNRATLVIDPGLGRANGEAVLREVAKVSRNSEVYIASTHYHAEHTTGYLAFPATAKYITSNVQEAEFAESAAAQIERFSGLSPLTGKLLEDAVGRKADITFDRAYTLDLGGVRVRMLEVGPTHTRGDIGFLVDGDAVLFAGDVVLKNSFLNANQGSSLRAWLAAFDVFEKMKPRTIVPAHGAVGDGSLIPTQRAIVLDIQARTRELKRQGRSIDEAATTVQNEWQAKHKTWPRAIGVAALARSAYTEAP